MTLRIFPNSPFAAPFNRQAQWGETGAYYDSGLAQWTTALTKPLYNFSFTKQNMPRSQQQSVEAFINEGRGRVTPFFIMDPYDYEDLANGRTFVQTGTAPTSAFWRNHAGYHYWPDSSTLSGYLTSNLSGTLTFGTDYTLEEATGILQFALQPTSADFWTVTNSTTYFKKVHASGPWQTASPKVWNQFDVRVTFKELSR